MKLSLQIPIPHLREFSGLEDFHFALAHLVLKDKYYAQTYAELGATGFVLLDNSTHELGTPLPMKDLLHAAWLCHADAIIPPDYFFNSQATMTSFASHIQDVHDPKLLWPVIQGNTFGELMECYTYYVEAGVDTICIPYRIGMEMRKRLIPNLSNRIHHHFLSFNCLAELTFIRNAPHPSLDTGKPFRWAQAGRRLLITDVTYRPAAKLDMHLACDRDLARENIYEVRKWMMS